VPYLGFKRAAISFSGASRAFAVRAANGNQAVRNFCPVCGSLVFGGPRDSAEEFTLYAGSLDDPSQFEPTAAIFTRARAPWAVLPAHLISYAQLPP